MPLAMPQSEDWRIDAPADAEAAPLLILAHGAGAPMDSPFMQRMAELLTAHGIAVARFNFGYMARAQREGRKIAPPRAERLMDEYRARVAEWHALGHTPFIGGKSMGGRVASMLADELFTARQAAGLVCLGYPFHAPGRPERLRIDHLKALRAPVLICQGERDPFGKREEVEGYPLAGTIRFCWLPDGDHDFKPRVKSGETWAGNMEMAADCAAAFIKNTAR